MSAGGRSGSEVRVWFLSPVVITLVGAIAAIVPAALLDDRQFRALWNTAKSITPETLAVFGSGALAMAFGSLIAMAVVRGKAGSSEPWPGAEAPSVGLLRRAAAILMVLTAVGYLGFGVLIAKSGIGLLDVVSGNPSYAGGPSLRDQVGTIPGVTTLTQFGIPAVVLSAVALAQSFRRREMLYIIAVLAMSTIRAYLFSERLAILEVAVPAGVILCARLAASGGAKRFMVHFTPVFAVPLVIALFGFFEYFRSWSF